jgi:hypothetical protein
MFVIADLKEMLISVPVNAEIAHGDGRILPVQFTLKCKLLPDVEIAELQQKGDRNFLKSVVNGWDGVKLDDGELAVFSEASFELMLSYACLRVAMIDAFYRATAEAARKNS